MINEALTTIKLAVKKMCCLSMTAVLGRRGFMSKDIVRFNVKRRLSSYLNRNKILSNNALLWTCCPSVSSCSINSRIFCSARTPISPGNFTETLTKQQAKDLASKLTPEERDFFMVALMECKSEKEKANYAGV